MATPPAGAPPIPPNPPDDAQKSAAKVSTAPIFVQVLNECNVNNDQLAKRQKLIIKMEETLTKRYGSANRLVSYVLRFGHAKTMMSTSDVPSLASMLSTVSGADQINLLVHSPGGDGTIAEKLIDMCRSHLSGQNQKLRVIVPNLAKSAATILALGADEILMGYVSDLGPIDPQIPIVVSGATQWVSAFAFVEARDKLVEQINVAIKKKEPTAALLQQLATLNIPFTDEMENQIAFSKKTAVTLLGKYMLKGKHPKPAQRAKKAVRSLKSCYPSNCFRFMGTTLEGPPQSK